MADPQELIAIWVADCWLMNLDREVEGNTRLIASADGKFHLLAADQSDCFLGSCSVADGSFLPRSKNQGAVAFPDKQNFVDRAVLEFGCNRLHATLDAISQVKGHLAGVMGLVPAAWWSQAGIAPDTIIQCLVERANRMRAIVNVERLEGISRVNTSNIRLFL
jgi:hypothetical protein